jgi:hypothetical protein
MYPAPVDMDPQNRNGWAPQQSFNFFNTSGTFEGRHSVPRESHSTQGYHPVSNGGGWVVTESAGSVPWQGTLEGPSSDLPPPLLTEKHPPQLNRIERTLANWIKKCNPPPTDFIVVERALYLADVSGDEGDRLKINAPGWLEKFKQTYREAVKDA